MEWHTTTGAVTPDYSLSSEQERELLEQSRRDPQAFRALYHCYFPKVYTYISYRVRYVEDVEDLTAQVFLKIVEGLNKFTYRGDGTFGAWLFRIAHNIVCDFYRREARANTSCKPIDDRLEVRDDLSLPDYQMIQRESFMRLHRLVDELPLRQQEIITLRFFGGLRNRSIAQILGLDERSVASHLCRGLRELQRKYVQIPELTEGGLDNESTS